jgi:hypothetical protein
MAKTERLRDLVAGDADPDLLARRTADGWTMTAIEWERRSDEGGEPDGLEPVPYGLRIARDCRHLEVDPTETEILALVTDMIVHEEHLVNIAEELNARGYRTRDNAHWTSTSVFKLMPRLVESSPRLFASPGWPRRAAGVR